LVIEGFVGDGGTKKSIEATVEIGGICLMRDS
jgi:hypothetical protein